MRATVPVVVLCCTTFAAAPARAGAPSVTLPAPVTAIAVAGAAAALVQATNGADCAHVVLWSVRTGSLVRLGKPRPCGPATSTGRGLTGAAVAGGRALWLTYAGGNIREWSLWTASRTAPAPRRLRFVARDVDAPQPILTGPGSSSLLPYAVDDTVVALRPDGARAFSWQAPARVTAVAAYGGSVWVAASGAGLSLVSGQGTARPGATLSGDAGVLVADAAGVFAQIGRTVELHAGGATQTHTLPTGAELLDAEAQAIVYRSSGHVHVYDFATGRDRSYTAAAGAAEGGTLFLAAGRTVTARPAP